jgi:hypothetical protein
LLAYLTARAASFGIIAGFMPAHRASASRKIGLRVPTPPDFARLVP